MSPYRIEGLIVIEWWTPNGIVIFVFYIWKLDGVAHTVADKFWFSISFFSYRCLGGAMNSAVKQNSDTRVSTYAIRINEIVFRYWWSSPIHRNVQFEIQIFPKLSIFSHRKMFATNWKRKTYIYIIFPRARDFGLARFLPDVNGTVRHAVYKLWILQANKAIRVQVSAPEFKTHCIQSGCWLTINCPFTAAALRPDIV